MSRFDYLQMLNPAQLEAVQHDPTVPLQILAGPGSGKTKVLTSRIAHLILNHDTPPSSICAVTFTNKAAKEMRERLTRLIGKEKTSELRMGTFHALCALFLRKYPQNAGIEANFTVCDTDESQRIISPLLKRYTEFLESKGLVLKNATVLSLISKAKAKGLSAKDYLLEIRRSLLPKEKDSTAINAASDAGDIYQIVAEIYQEYEVTLRRNNSLDFDDLLLFGVKLFSYHKPAVKWCRHILVDEFQDTNITQYEIMGALAFSHCITIVGDPDQSIYGWRSAEVGNLARMRKDFPRTMQILLEQNYRSTGSILQASLAIVAQDKTRIPKCLYTAHPKGIRPVLVALNTEYVEAAYLASEVKRLVAYTGGMLKWGDFAILLRFNALSRAIESALQKEGIPNRILNGHKFFERMEIKDLLAYLQIVDNPQFAPAFNRAVNVPSRGIGEKTLADIKSRAEKAQLSPLSLVEKILDGRAPDTKPAVKRKLASFVSTIRALRQLAYEHASPSTIIRKLLDLVEYENHLRKTEQDWETRWENVQELITFASDVEGEVQSAVEDDNTPLRLFLQASMLSSEGDNQNENDNCDKVTISTCHAAKGLEWPVVMVPSVEQRTFPFYRSEDTDEERRLLYVACTRAQSFLYLSHVANRKVGGQEQKRELSVFVSAAIKENPSLFADECADLSAQDRFDIAKVLGRPRPDESLVHQQVADFELKHPPSQPEKRVSLDNVRKPLRHVQTSDSPFIVQATGHTPFVPFLEPSSKAPIWDTPTPTSSTPRSSAIHSQMPFSGSSVLPVQRPPIVSPSYISQALISSTSALTSTSTSASSHSVKPDREQITRSSVVPARYPPIVSLSKTLQGSVPASMSRASGPALCDDRPHEDPSPPPPSQPTRSAPVAGMKRRLGMGRSTGGYSNKKFKLPT